MAKMNYMEPIFFTPPRNKLDRALYKDSPSPAPAPTSQTVTNTSIPEYARPYVETMLGKTQALTDINANPYQTYGGTRIAGFSPLQQQAFGNVANQQTASQLGTATNLAGMSGLGSIGTANQMAGAGANYNAMATNPGAVSAFMNPYLQSSLAPQLAEIQRQSDITGMGLKGQSVAQGAFGGNRAALQQAENQRNALMAKQQAIGSGYNTAFQNAQQAQQFGANLGLQGLQGALSGYGQAGAAAGTLGQLGQTQFGQQQAINQAQQQVGAVQQAQQQQQLDQAYQDFLKQKNYPYQQLAFMSDMVRGLPLSQSAQQQYTAPPSMVSQLGGLGMAGLGIYGASGGFKNNKAGGVIEEQKYAGGGKTQMMSDEQLEKIISDMTSNPLAAAAAEEQKMLRARMRNNPALRSGVAAIATDDMVPENMAGGGIVAFKEPTKENNYSLVKADEDYYRALDESPIAQGGVKAIKTLLSPGYVSGKAALNYLGDKYDDLRGNSVMVVDPETGRPISKTALKNKPITQAAKDVAATYRASQPAGLATVPIGSVADSLRVASDNPLAPLATRSAIADKTEAPAADKVAAATGAGIPMPRGMDYNSLKYKAPTDRSAEFDPMNKEAKTPEQLMAEHQARLGENEGLAALKAKLAGMEAKAAGEEERAPWMALAKAGFATMAGKSQNALSNIGEGAKEGLSDYVQAKKDIASSEDKRFALANQLSQAERAEKIATVKFGEDSAEAIDAKNRANKLAALNYKVNRDIAISKGEQDAAANIIHAKQTDAQLAQSAAQHQQTYELQKKRLDADLADKPLDTQVAILTASLKGSEATIRDQNAEPEDKAAAIANSNLVTAKLNELGGVKRATGAALPMAGGKIDATKLVSGTKYMVNGAPMTWNAKTNHFE